MKQGLRGSKIPVFKKVKVLKPLKNVTSEKFCESHFKYCRNCNVLENNLRTTEMNIATLLKENNFLRQQLANIDLSYTLPFKVQQTDDCQVVDELTDNPQTEKPIDAELINHNSDIDVNSQPYSLIPEHPFAEFDVGMLDRETKYTHDLSNRKIKFFGDVPYYYSNIVHQPCSIPEDSYLLKITNLIKTLLPKFSFNSVLINKYSNGYDHIPMHSDNEECIKPNSNIVTVSLGETRKINFQPIVHSHGSDISIDLQHGDVFVMSSKSQKLFRHGIPQDKSKSMRISLTFRDLIWPHTNPTSILPPCPVTIDQNTHLSPVQNVTTEVTAESDRNVDTLFISSSMFANLDHSKLSSKNHKAAVFFYRGATAGNMLSRLQQDPTFNNVVNSNIKQIFLLCGSNDVDNILHVQRRNHSNCINVDSINYDQYKMENTMHEMHNLVNFLHSRYFNATVKVMNILPRISKSRNQVINQLNKYLKDLCYRFQRLEFINTEYNINLFSSHEGFRKNAYFANVGSDNVHLNKAGVVRLGRHLKYLSHLDFPKVINDTI